MKLGSVDFTIPEYLQSMQRTVGSIALVIFQHHPAIKAWVPGSLLIKFPTPGDWLPRGGSGRVVPRLCWRTVGPQTRMSPYPHPADEWPTSPPEKRHTHGVLSY